MLENQDITEHMLRCAGIELVEPSNMGTKNPNFYAINWPDGSLRWLFNVTGCTPGFLAFYSASNLRAKLGAVFMRCIAALGLMGRFSSKFSAFRLVDNGVIAKSLIECNCNNWSLFAGTPGIDRKLVVALYQNKTVKYYIKIPISDSSLKLVIQEHKALYSFLKFDFKKIITPHSQLFDGFLILSNVSDSKTITVSKLNNYHFIALNEVYLKTKKKVLLTDYISQNSFVSDCENILTLQPIESQFNKETLNRIINNVKRLIKCFEAKYHLVIEVSLAHRDLTPWNSFIRKDKLVLLDFELMEFDVSMGFDLFHFVSQTNIMFGRNITVDSYLQECIEKFKVSFKNSNEELVLIYVVLYNIKQMLDYLPKYLNQNDPHPQVFDQIIWWDTFFSYDYLHNA